MNCKPNKNLLPAKKPTDPALHAQKGRNCLLLLPERSATEPRRSRWLLAEEERSDFWKHCYCAAVCSQVSSSGNQRCMPAIIPRTVLGKNEVNFEASRAIPCAYASFSGFEPKQQLLDKGQQRGRCWKRASERASERELESGWIRVLAGLKRRTMEGARQREQVWARVKVQ